MRTNRNKALTLVELMVALAIVAMLTAAALAVATNLARSGRLADKTASQDSLEQSLAGVLEADLAHATRFRNTTKGVEIQTYLHLGPADMETSHLPVTAVYQLRQAGGQMLLVRVQKQSETDDFAELVCSGVAGLAIRAAGGAPSGSPGTDANKPIVGEQWQTMPKAVIVMVKGEDGRQFDLTVRKR